MASCYCRTTRMAQTRWRGLWTTTSYGCCSGTASTQRPTSWPSWRSWAPLWPPAQALGSGPWSESRAGTALRGCICGLRRRRIRTGRFFELGMAGGPMLIAALKASKHVSAPHTALTIGAYSDQDFLLPQVAICAVGGARPSPGKGRSGVCTARCRCAPAGRHPPAQGLQGVSAGEQHVCLQGPGGQAGPHRGACSHAAGYGRYTGSLRVPPSSVRDSLFQHAALLTAQGEGAFQARRL